MSVSRSANLSSPSPSNSSPTSSSPSSSGSSNSGSSSSGFSSSQEEALLTLFRTADALEHELQLRLKPYGITGAQYNVLRILRAAQSQVPKQKSPEPKSAKPAGAKPAGDKAAGLQSTGLMCSAIGRLMITPEPDITRLLARLKAHKLVTQKRDSRDGRVVLTYLSPAGAQLLARLDSLIGETPAELLSGLSPAEVTELTRLLGKAQAPRNPHGSCEGKKEETPQPVATGRSSLPHSPRWSLPRHHPE